MKKFKKNQKIRLAKYKVANLNQLFGGDGDEETMDQKICGTQTEDKKSKVIIFCPRGGNNSNDMDCPQLSYPDGSPCNS